MKALLCRQYCDWDELKLEEIAPQELTGNSVRIRIDAASVSFAMSLQVAGKYQVRYPMPFIPGTEVGGVVTELARGVPGLRVGDRVLALLDYGGMAQETVIRHHTVYKLPEGLPVVPAIHLPNAYGTAYGALIWRGGLDASTPNDKTVVVTGAAGAVGCAAVQIASLLGARVIAVASSAAKRDFAFQQGANLAVDYESMREAVLDATHGKGADLVLDQVGGDSFVQALRCTATFGQIVTIGYAGGTIPNIPANLLLVKNISVLGHNMGMYFGWGPADRRVEFEPAMRQMMDQLFEWTLAGRLRPTVSHEFGLEDYRAAMKAVLERRSTGKVIVRP